jgi:hypothetical protein
VVPFQLHRVKTKEQQFEPVGIWRAPTLLEKKTDPDSMILLTFKGKASPLPIGPWGLFQLCNHQAFFRALFYGDSNDGERNFRIQGNLGEEEVL